MLATASRRALADAAKAAIVPTRNAHQAILSGLHVEADAVSGVVTLTSTNLDLTCTVDVRAEVETAGAVVVPAAKVADFFARTSGELVELRLDGDLEMSCGEATISLRTFDVTAWPKTQLVDAVEGPVLSPGDLERIDGVLFAAVKDQEERIKRPVLAGVHFFGNQVECCNTYCIALAELDVEMPDIVVPADVMQRVVKVAAGEGCTVSTDSRRVTFATADWTWTTTLMMQEYPPGPRSAIRATSPAEWRFESAALKASLERIALLDSNDETIDAKFGRKKIISHVTMTRDGGKVLLRNAAADLGEIADAIPVDGDFEGPLILDHRLVSQLLAAHNEPTITFEIDSCLKPIQARSGDRRTVRLQMPVRPKVRT